MEERTVRALVAINRAFYADRAEEFRAARQRPWPGWERLLPLCDGIPGDEPWDVLDVGCGHARFADFLCGRGRRFRYTGVDASEPLLAAARARDLPGARVSLARQDVFLPGAPERLPAGPFSLVALFGVLHHVPGRAGRRALLGALAGRLAPGGLLAVAVWRFATGPRFRDRIVPWEDWNRVAREPVALDQLEPGDVLLRWGADGDAVGHGHAAGDDEVEDLLAELPLETAASYDSDGREGNVNRYHVLRRP